MNHVRIEFKSILNNQMEGKSVIKNGDLDRYWLGREVEFENTYIIFLNNQAIGLIELDVDKYKNHHKYGTIGYIELVRNNRHRGIGQLVLKSVFQTFKLSTIYGESLPSAIPFWKRVGADFELSDAKLMNHYNSGWSACFKLTKQSFKG